MNRSKTTINISWILKDLEILIFIISLRKSQHYGQISQTLLA